MRVMVAAMVNSEARPLAPAANPSRDYARRPLPGPELRTMGGAHEQLPDARHQNAGPARACAPVSPVPNTGSTAWFT